MLLLTAAALSAATPAITVPGSRAASPQCPRTISQYAAERGNAAQFHKLNELPDANAYKAVYRTVGGCEAPLLVKYNVSGRR